MLPVKPPGHNTICTQQKEKGNGVVEGSSREIGGGQK